MVLRHAYRSAFALISIIAAICFGQPRDRIEPGFSLSLSGKCCGGTPYHYVLNQAGDSGSVIVRSTERRISRVNFCTIKKTIISCAMNLTEANYGAPHDSTDFSGELSIAALDHATVIRTSTRVVIGTQSDSSMAVLLRLIMDQVDDTLRLPMVARSEQDRTPKVLIKGKSRKSGKN
jgi:hypothetical protein